MDQSGSECARPRELAFYRKRQDDRHDRSNWQIVKGNDVVGAFKVRGCDPIDFHDPSNDICQLGQDWIVKCKTGVVAQDAIEGDRHPLSRGKATCGHVDDRA